MTSAQCDTKNAFGRRKIEANFSFDSFLSRSALLYAITTEHHFKRKVVPILLGKGRILLIHLLMEKHTLVSVRLLWGQKSRVIGVEFDIFLI